MDLKKILCTANFTIFTQFLCGGNKLSRIGKNDFFKVPNIYIFLTYRDAR